MCSDDYRAEDDGERTASRMEEAIAYSATISVRVSS